MFQLWWGHKTRLQPGLYWARCTGAKLWETERFYVEKAWGKVEQNMENIVVGICFTTYTSISTFLIFFETPMEYYSIMDVMWHLTIKWRYQLDTVAMRDECGIYNTPDRFSGYDSSFQNPRLVNHWVNIDHMCHGHYFEYMPGYAYPPLIQVCFPCVRNPLW